MTPQVASMLKIHEPDVAQVTAGGEGVLTAPRLSPLVREHRPELDDACLPALWRREALHRRLLGTFDLIGASLVLCLVLGLTRGENVAVAAFVGLPMLLVPFKIAGLYDRDELRLVHSTLD